MKAPVSRKTALRTALLCGGLAAPPCAPAGASPPFAPAVSESVLVQPTFACTGIQWFISGDPDRDAFATVEFREAGSGTWLPVQPLARVATPVLDSECLIRDDLLAGSVFGLEPGTPYEIRLRLVDPDGTDTTIVRPFSTRAPLDAFAPRRVRHVVPGAGGGSGTPSDPFRGVASADAAASPGDLFLLHAGVYADSVTFLASGTASDPIVWRGESRDAVVFDGGGQSKSVISFEAVSYVRLENVTVRRPYQLAIDGRSTRGCVVRRCSLDVSEYTGALDMAGIQFKGPGHADGVVTENVIRGFLRWEDGRHEDAYGIQMEGTGHVVSHNEVFDWYDGVQLGGWASVSSESDLYGNEIYRCTDDGIEADSSWCNVRIFRNRITNVLCGISAQPVLGGPVYLVRNVVYNWQLKPLKFHLWPSGLLVYHNTLVGADPCSWHTGQWKHVRLRNNLLLGGNEPGHNADPICLNTEGSCSDLDYDGWYQARPDRFALFNDIFYASLGAFRSGTGHETHGVLVDYATFVAAEVPPLGSWLGAQGFPLPYAPDSQDLRLAPGSPAIDAGEILTNVNDAFLSSAPDLGAYELGGDVPVYGPGGSAPLHTPQPDAHGLVLRATPNPFRGEVRLSIELPSARPVTLRIFDVSGRLVRTLREEADGRGGPRVAVWNGRGATGRPLPAGIYLVRIEAGNASAACRIAKIW